MKYLISIAVLIASASARYHIPSEGPRVPIPPATGSGPHEPYGQNSSLPSIKVISSTKKVHVGYFVGQELKNWVRDSIDNMCGMTCNGDPSLSCCQTSTSRVFNHIRYQDAGKIAEGGTLSLQVSYGNASNGFQRVLQVPLIETVANTFKRQTEIPQNCYEANVEGNTDIWCNIASNVSVEVPGKAMLNVNLSFDHANSTSGAFVCEATRGRIQQLIDSDLNPSYATALGANGQKVHGTVECSP